MITRRQLLALLAAASAPSAFGQGVSSRGVRALNDLLRTDSRVSATTIQTVGVKGYDGFTIAVVN